MAANHHTRKPAHMEMIGGKSKRQRMWEAIRAKRSGFTLMDIATAAELEIDAVTAYLAALRRGQWLVQTNDAGSYSRKAKRYALARDNGIEAPRVNRRGQAVTHGLIKEQLWRTMRLIGEFDRQQLAACASTPALPITPAVAGDYLRHLEHAGYISRLSGGKGGVQARWVFNHARYSGPRPPIVQRTQSVYDPNLDRVVWQEEINDDDL